MPIEPVSIEDVKRQLKLDQDFADDDLLLAGYITAARRTSEAITGISLADDPVMSVDPSDLAVIGQAMLMTIAHWYRNRESVTTEQGRTLEMPLSTRWLLGAIRRRSL